MPESTEGYGHQSPLPGTGYGLTDRSWKGEDAGGKQVREFFTKLDGGEDLYKVRL